MPVKVTTWRVFFGVIKRQFYQSFPITIGENSIRDFVPQHLLLLFHNQSKIRNDKNAKRLIQRVCFTLWIKCFFSDSTFFVVIRKQGYHGRNYNNKSGYRNVFSLKHSRFPRKFRRQEMRCLTFFERNFF